MARLVTIKKNPSKQYSDQKVLEIAYHINGAYYGCLLSINCLGNKPNLRVYSIDEGINVGITDKRERRE